MGCLTTARIQLLLNRPFFGSLLLHLKVKEMPLPYPAVVTPEYLIVDPQRVADYTKEQKEAVVAHETLHVALLHVFEKRRKGRDKELWNVAADYAVNAALRQDGFSFPSTWLYSKAFDDMTAEQIYDQLKENAKAGKKSPKSPMPDLDSSCIKGKLDDEAGDGNSDLQRRSDTEEGDSPSDKGKPDGDAGNKQAVGVSNSDDETENSVGKSDDEQDDDKQDDTNDAEQGVEDKESGAGEKDSTKQPEKTDDDWMRYWQDALVSAATHAHMRGTCPGFIKQMVNDLLNPVIPWQLIVDTFLAETCPDDYDLYPERRYIDYGCYVPSLQGEKRKLAVAIDTSGSISNELIKDFLSEVKGLMQSRGIESCRFIQCDAAIHYDAILRTNDDVPVEVYGRGGTDFRPVINKLVKENDRQLAGLLFFTDLDGMHTDEPPPFPVLWIVKNTDRTTTAALLGNSLKPPYGRVASFDGERLVGIETV